jgi:hypothetical protein
MFLSRAAKIIHFHIRVLISDVIADGKMTIFFLSNNYENIPVQRNRFFLIQEKRLNHTYIRRSDESNLRVYLCRVAGRADPTNLLITLQILIKGESDTAKFVNLPTTRDLIFVQPTKLRA